MINHTMIFTEGMSAYQPGIFCIQGERFFYLWAINIPQSLFPWISMFEEILGLWIHLHSSERHYPLHGYFLLGSAAYGGVQKAFISNSWRFHLFARGGCKPNLCESTQWSVCGTDYSSVGGLVAVDHVWLSLDSRCSELASRMSDIISL